jgi:integrase
MTGSLYKRGKVWWMAYMVSGHQYCESTKTVSRKIAAKILNIRVTGIIEGQYRLPKSNPPKLDEWATQFLGSISNPITKRTYKSCVNILVQFFGSIPLSRISCEIIEQFKMARREGGAGPASINRNLAVLKRMLKLAERQRLIVRSPFADVDFLEERSMRRQATVLSFDEQKRLEAAAPPHLRTLIVLLTETGLRVGKEALPLKWEDVDLPQGVLHVRLSKTPAGRRVVPLSKHCARALKEWMKLTGPKFSSYVFANPHNPEGHLKSVRKTWDRALKCARVEKRPIYHLRATFASRLSAAGASDNLVAGMLGHSSPIILNTYAKVVDEYRRAAIQKLDVLRNAPASNEKPGNLFPLENRRRRTNWVN